VVIRPAGLQVFRRNNANEGSMGTHRAKTVIRVPTCALVGSPDAPAFITDFQAAD